MSIRENSENGIAAKLYVMKNPDGETIAISKEVWDAVHEYTVRKFSGRVEIDFRSGGFAGVRMTRVLK